MIVSSAAAWADFTPYQGYVSYKPSTAACATNPGWSDCNGTQEQCEANPGWSTCNGTLAQCEANPGWSTCNGTRAQCDANPGWSTCNGTRAQCEAYPTWSTCRTAPAADPCEDDYYSSACREKRCQDTFSNECRDIYCRYHPENDRCWKSDPTPPIDPTVDQFCRSHGYVRP